MAMRRSDGKDIERLVSALERVLAGTGARIETRSRRLIDRDTGRPREHDVLIIWDHGHHQIVTAIECRDRSRPVGVPAVEAFADKCAATGVHSGVIVSSTGFTGTARTKAAVRSITCMDLEEVQEFGWFKGAAIIGYERQFGTIDAQFMFVGEHPTSMVSVIDSRGTEFPSDNIFRTIMNAVPPSADPEAEVGQTIPVHMRMITPDWQVRDAEGRTWPLVHIDVTADYSVLKTEHMVQTHRYTGGGKDYGIASTDAVFDTRAGKLMLVHEESEGISLAWAPDKPVG